MFKIDFGRIFKAPFHGDGRTELPKVYLTAGLITLAVFIVILIISVGIEGIKMAIFGLTPKDLMPQMVLSILFSLVILVVQIFLYGLPFGYVNETIRLEVKDSDCIMPNWEGNYKRFFFDGMKLMTIVLIYMMVLVFIPTAIVAALCYFTVGLPMTEAEMISNFPTGYIIIGLSYLAFILIYFLIYPFVWIRYAVEQRFAEAFNLFAIFKKIFANIGSYIVALLFVIVLIIIMQISTMILCCTCIGTLLIPVVCMFIFPIMFGNMFAQVYKD